MKRVKRGGESNHVRWGGKLAVIWIFRDSQGEGAGLRKEKTPFGIKRNKEGGLRKIKISRNRWGVNDPGSCD